MLDKDNELQIGGCSKKSMLNRNLFLSSSSNYLHSRLDDRQIVE